MLREKEMDFDISDGKITVLSSAWDLEVEFDENSKEKEIHFNKDLSLVENEDGISLIFHNDTGEGRDRRNMFSCYGSYEEKSIHNRPIPYLF
jgi:hypothetical protein